MFDFPYIIKTYTYTTPYQGIYKYMWKLEMDVYDYRNMNKINTYFENIKTQISQMGLATHLVEIMTFHMTVHFVYESDALAVSLVY